MSDLAHIERLKNTRPTSEARSLLERAIARQVEQNSDSADDHPVADQVFEEQIAHLRAEVVLAEERDRVHASRPYGCRCLGAGGRFRHTLKRTGLEVFREYCACPDGATARAADHEARCLEQRADATHRAEFFREDLPPHFANMTLDSYPAHTPRQRAIVDRLRAWLDDQENFDHFDAKKEWLLLYGRVGVGKSGLAVATAVELVERGLGKTPMFVNVTGLLDRLREGYARDADESATNVMDSLRDADPLVLDDLGAERSNPWALERLFVLLNHRHDYRKPTIVTTNLSPSQLAVQIGERSMDRIRELALVLPLKDCPNLRGERPLKDLAA